MVAYDTLTVSVVVRTHLELQWYYIDGVTVAQ